MQLEEARRRAKSGPLILFARRIIVVLIQLLSTITVARLVPPMAYGLANMATVILAFGQMFRDFGLTNAVLRKGEISQNELSFLFWLNAASTVALVILIAALSPAIAAFYREPVVAKIVLVSLVGFLIGGLALQHRAHMNRDLRFGALAVIDIIAVLAGFATTLAIALVRHDVWAIVIGTIVQSCVGSILYVAKSGWRPSRFSKPADSLDIIRFAANTSIFSIATFLSNNAASLLIGHYLGSSKLGQYNRAQVLYQLPNTNLVQPITQASMPLLIRLRSEPAQYRDAYLALVRKLCAFLMPMSVTLCIAAPAIVRTLLGDKWAEAGLVLAALSPALAGMGIAYAISDLFITQDRSAELRKIGVYEMLFRVGCVALAVRYGLVAAALSFSFTTLVATAARVIIVGKSGPVGRMHQIKAAIPACVLTLGALAGCLGTNTLLELTDVSTSERAVALIAGGIFGSMVFGLSRQSSRNVMLELVDAFGLLRIWNKLHVSIRQS